MAYLKLGREISVCHVIIENNNLHLAQTMLLNNSVTYKGILPASATATGKCEALGVSKFFTQDDQGTTRQGSGLIRDKGRHPSETL